MRKDRPLEHKRRRVDVVTDEGFLDDLESLDDAELRRRRQMCSDLDRELSYQRRLLHSRIDLLTHERRHRRGEEPLPPLDALPAILDDTAETDHVTADNADGTPPRLPTPGSRAIDQVLGDDFLTRLPEIDDAELSDLGRRLESIEGDVSAQRRRVHAAQDALSDELARRYRSGAAAVDDLLRD